MIWRIKRWLRIPKPLKGIRREIHDLEIAILETDANMSEISRHFWANGGICCPGCGVRGYNDLEEKQMRRYKRLEQLKEKLARDSNSNAVSLKDV